MSFDLIISDGWIYCYLPHGLYKMNCDTPSMFRLDNSTASNVQMLKGWIYFMDVSGADTNMSFPIYRIRTDGTGKEHIGKEFVSTFYIDGDWIYYGCSSDMDTLYKMKIDGSCKTKVDDEMGVRRIAVSKDWVYYTAKAYMNSSVSTISYLYKVKTNGIKHSRLIEDKLGVFGILNDKLIYTNRSDNSKIYIVNTDGSGRTKICDDEAIEVAVVAGKVYYINTKNKIYQMKVDGSSKREIK